ncbi:MAG TPA: SCE4755 family polysaccharide monooxygenase-like protein [Vicinamibacterales bacterium]|nr:SCE4755 family polysaccharide monooxygenase-like protein [Vicinamibacterales bacterium]
MRLSFVALLIIGTAPVMSADHFKLLEPASRLVEDQRGDPQKLGPCGGTSANAGTPTGTVSQAVGGSKLHIKVQETIYHPGFYRVSLAVKSLDELPADPVAITRETEKGPWSISGAMQSNPQMPVLADGLNSHRTRPASGTQLAPFETDVQLPNVNCEKCTVQIIQFMEDHGYNKDGGYTYHHCADIKITADPNKPVDKAWPGQS